jgi:Tfp pilus assembly protein PilO
MKTEAKITGGTIRLKKILEYFRKPHILYGSCVFFGLIILILAYWPLIIKLHQAAKSLWQLQSELLSQRSAIAVAEDLGTRGEIIPQNEVPQAIVEITEKGRELGLDFSSISPRALQQTAQPDIGKLPISFVIESEYKNLGQLLIYIEEHFHSVAEVESISIHPSKSSLPKLSVELVLNLYVETENET